ncbi:hypothetical protein [Chlamydiifrater volucris]|uniref:hypothetical protein n=1 Tax=Chlamydiifrater volucris TaxID=2681470 RepID=UPI0032B2FB6F
MEEQPLEENLPGEEETSKTKISFPTFNRYTVTTLIDNKENQPESLQTPAQPREFTLEKNEDIKANAITIEKNLFTNSLYLTKNLISKKSLTGNQGVFIKGNVTLTPQKIVNIEGKLNLLNSTILYKNAARDFDLTRISDRKNQEYVPYGELKKYGIAFYTRSAWTKGQVGVGGSVYRGQYFSWNDYAPINELKYPDNDDVFQLEGPDGSHNEEDYHRNFYLAFRKPGIYRISVGISKHGAWLDNGRGGLNELKVTFANGYTHKIGHMTTAGQTNYNYRSSGIVGAVISATESGKFWIECIGPSYRVNFFEWSVIRLPSLQWDP